MTPPRRRPSYDSAKDAAEAAFRTATTRAPDGPAKPAVPGVRQSVTLRIDEEVLEHFQADGPGWQDRINDALRRIIAK